jgi:hypothetical protein
MMHDEVFIVGFFVLGIYKTFELFARRRERTMFIEKFFEHCEKLDLSDSFKMPPISFGNANYGSSAIKIALLLMGVGLGCLLSFFTYLVCEAGGFGLSNEMLSFLSFAYITIFGGLGLLISYLIELRQNNKKGDKN